MKALRELAGLKKGSPASAPNEDLESEWDRLFSKPVKKRRPPAALPLGRREEDIIKEQDSERQLKRSGIHDPVYLEDRFSTVFPLDRHELSSVSERTEAATAASPRSASDSLPSSGSHRALSQNEPFAVSSSTSASEPHPGPPPTSALPPLPAISPRPRATSASILAKLAPYGTKQGSQSTSDIPPNASSSTSRSKLVRSEIEKVQRAELIFRDRIRKEEEHKRRKAWLDEKNSALRRLKFDPAGAAREIGQLYFRAGTEGAEVDDQSLDTAAAWFEKSLDTDPTQAEVFYWLARSYDRKGADSVRMDRASYAYRTAVDLEGKARYWCSLGVFEAGRRHFVRAREAFERAVAAAEDQGEDAAVAWSNLGQLYEHSWDAVAEGKTEHQRFEKALESYLRAFELARGSDFAMSVIARYDRLQQIRSTHFDNDHVEIDSLLSTARSQGQADLPTLSSAPWRVSSLSVPSRRAGTLGPSSELIVPDTPVVTSASSSHPPSPAESPAKVGAASPPPLLSAGLNSAFSNPTASALSAQESRRSRRSSSGSSHKAQHAAGLRRIVEVLDRQSIDARERNDRLVEVLSQIRDRLPLKHTSATAAGSTQRSPKTSTADASLIEALRTLGDGTSRLSHILHEHRGAPAGLRALNTLLTSSAPPETLAHGRPYSR